MQKAFEKIKEKLEEEKINLYEAYKETEHNIDYGALQEINEVIKIVNKVAEEYVPDTNVGRTAWETIYKQILKLEKEYSEAGDVKNSDELIKLSNLLRHYKEQLTEEADSTNLDGWIPCSKGLPEEPETGMKDMEFLPEYNVTIKGADGATTLHYAGDGEWYDCLTQEFYDVVAWQPLPEPYREKE